MKIKLFGLTIEIKKKVSLEKRLIKEYGARAYKMALIYCKNLTEDELRETCELAKTNIAILVEAMHEGDVLPKREMFEKLKQDNKRVREDYTHERSVRRRAECTIIDIKEDLRISEEELKQIKEEKKDADELIEKMLDKIAECEEVINKLNSNEASEPAV